MYNTRVQTPGFITLLIVILISLGANFKLIGQKQKGSTIEVAFGSRNAVHPFTLGYRSPTFALFHSELGYRMMPNEMVGYKIHGGLVKL